MWIFWVENVVQLRIWGYGSIFFDRPTEMSTYACHLASTDGNNILCRIESPYRLGCTQRELWIPINKRDVGKWYKPSFSTNIYNNNKSAPSTFRYISNTVVYSVRCKKQTNELNFWHLISVYIRFEIYAFAIAAVWVFVFFWFTFLLFRFPIDLHFKWNILVKFMKIWTRNCGALLKWCNKSSEKLMWINSVWNSVCV